jgi:DNA polymerase III alpha subunit
VKTQVEGDNIRLGLTNIKYVGDKVAAAVVRNRPYANYAELAAKVKENGSGMNTRMLDSMNKIGASAFPDNPRRGDEREYFYEYLQIPAFEVKDLDPQVKYRMREVEDYDEEDTFAVLATVRKITRKDGWARVEVIDNTGTASIFAPQDIPMETGQMYAILVSNNRIARYLTMDELHDGVTTEFSRWLHGELPPPENEGFYRVVSFRTRMTKANKKMADIVLQDHLGHLMSAMVWPDNPYNKTYTKAFSKCSSKRSMQFEFGETETGGLFVKDIK